MKIIILSLILIMATQQVVAKGCNRKSVAPSKNQDNRQISKRPASERTTSNRPTSNRKANERKVSERKTSKR